MDQAAGDPPEVTTGGVEVWGRVATVYGRVIHNDLDTTWYFEYGETTAMELTTDRATIEVQPSTPLEVEVYTDLDDFEFGTKYYYRIVAENEAGTTYGDTANFGTNEIGAGSCFIGVGSAGD